MLIQTLENYGASKYIVSVLSSFGIKVLYLSQSKAIEEGLLESKKSFVIAAPTASGKTLLAEMAALQVIENGGKVVYLVPLRALAREKFDDFSKKYSHFGIKVMVSTGDFDSADPWLHSADIIITTNEKMDSLIRHQANWLKSLKLVVADEIHLIGDPHRGPTLEIVLSRIRWLNPHIRIIALSATIPNAREIANWLDAKLVESNWRPVPLKEGIFLDNLIEFDDGTIKEISYESGKDVIDLAIDTIKDSGQALIFVNTRKSAESMAREASKHIIYFYSDEEKKNLEILSNEIISSTSEPTRLCRKLSEYIKSGVAFHHAGINSQQRRIVEDAFRKNKIKLITATTTLAMGMNLPSRRVIIRDWYRYLPGIGKEPISVIEIKQMCGRAGRPEFDEYGEAVIVAKNIREREALFEKYIFGSLERIESKIANESALRTHILASIAGMFTRTRQEILEFMQKTFFAFQNEVEELSFIVDSILEFLLSEEMIYEDKKAFYATKFGHRVSDLYIDPLTGVLLRDSILMPKKKTAFALLHMVSRTPDMIYFPLKAKEFDSMVEIFYKHAEELLIPENDKIPSDIILSQLKTASILMNWIEEKSEDWIVGQFAIGPGDLRTLIEISQWLLYASYEIAKVFEVKDAYEPITILKLRVSYGVKEELIELITLKGVGRVRARNLYNAGFKTIKELKKASLEDLEKIPTIGKALATDIKRQVV